MGVIRSILLVLASVLMFLCIIVLTLSAVLSQSLAYENVEKYSSVIIGDFLEENINFTEKINATYPVILHYCQNNEKYVFNFEDRIIEISCDKALLGAESAINEGINEIIKEMYYTDYECKFLDCFKKDSLSGFTPFFLVSENAQIFWTFLFKFMFTASILLAVVVFFLVSKKSNMPLITGISLIIPALLFFKLDHIFSISSEKVIFRFIGVLFSESFSVSVRVLIAGIAFILAGIIMKIFRIGFWISKITSKIAETKNKLKDETKKEKSEKPEKQNIFLKLIQPVKSTKKEKKR